MANSKPGEFLLYSTCTTLAYKIATRYYNDIHYVWCTEAFNAMLQPGTSNPCVLCMRYLDQIIRKDRHAQEIDNNKAGIRKGAEAKKKQGVITEKQYEEICVRVAVAENEDFYPVIYLINKKAVKNRLRVVEPKDAASDSSIEYIIEDLKRNEFEIIRVKDFLSNFLSSAED